MLWNVRFRGQSGSNLSFPKESVNSHKRTSGTLQPHATSNVITGSRKIPAHGDERTVERMIEVAGDLGAPFAVCGVGK